MRRSHPDKYVHPRDETEKVEAEQKTVFTRSRPYTSTSHTLFFSAGLSSTSSEKRIANLWKLIREIAKRDAEKIQEILNEPPQQSTCSTNDDDVLTLVNCSNKLLPDHPILWALQRYHQNPSPDGEMAHLHTLIQNRDRVNALTHTSAEDSLETINHFIRDELKNDSTLESLVSFATNDFDGPGVSGG